LRHWIWLIVKLTVICYALLCNTFREPTILESHNMNFGAVVIGRNEGERLRRCLRSLSRARVVVYVDSGSIDGSAEWARNHGADVVELDSRVPFTAARARNAGFHRLRAVAPDLLFVQFVDGDCELVDSWSEDALSFLDWHRDYAAAFGRLRERYPERSIYNWLCDQEWNVPVGEARTCGGIAMMRVDALIAVGVYREDLIAGEEPELCVRLRVAGWRIHRLDAEMAVHDAAMTHVGQWWRRTVRTGYGIAQGAQLHGASPERLWVWESRRAWVWAVLVPLASVIAGVAFSPWGWAAWIIYPLQILRQMARNPGRPRQRALLALFQILARFPEVWGQVKFMRDNLTGRHAAPIEYK
jgi:GT2 family glycosyltransferase